jgi:hypothetical protein
VSLDTNDILSTALHIGVSPTKADLPHRASPLTCSPSEECIALELLVQALKGSFIPWVNCNEMVSLCDPSFLNPCDSVELGSGQVALTSPGISSCKCTVPDGVESLWIKMASVDWVVVEDGQ